MNLFRKLKQLATNLFRKSADAASSYERTTTASRRAAQRALDAERTLGPAQGCEPTHPFITRNDRRAHYKHIASMSKKN